jgi:hypothetical protein
MAPAEGNVPTGVLMDEDAEALSFPKIYCGKQRKTNFTKELLMVKLLNLILKDMIVDVPIM